MNKLFIDTTGFAWRIISEKQAVELFSLVEVYGLHHNTPKKGHTADFLIETIEDINPNNAEMYALECGYIEDSLGYQAEQGQGATKEIIKLLLS